MIDWTSSMNQTFEFYKVDPYTWRDSELVTTITSCNIDRDLSNETLGSASIDSTEIIEECYIRVYLVVNQNELTSKVPLGTFLVQTPGVSFDGKASSITMDAYTPLIELKSTMPPIGYSILEDKPIMELASDLCEENLRAPVVSTKSSDKLKSNFVANLNDNWLSFISDLIANAKYSFYLDDMGRVIFEKNRDMRSLQPVWTYDDGNSSILYPNISHEQDLYSIPNVVEVVYSENVGFRKARVVNKDKNSPISTVNRGREVLYRDTNPNFSGVPTDEQLKTYAKQLLRNLSSLEHKITYKHGYCPVKVGDCVLLNYERAGIENVKAKVISQSISCETGCPVEETAVYTTSLWGD